MMVIFSEKLKKLMKLIEPYEEYDLENGGSKLVNDAPEEVKKLFPEYIVLRHKELSGLD